MQQPESLFFRRAGPERPVVLGPHHETPAPVQQLLEKLERVGPAVGEVDPVASGGRRSDFIQTAGPKPTLASAAITALGGGLPLRRRDTNVQQLADEAENGAVGRIDGEDLLGDPAASPAVADGAEFVLQAGVPGEVEQRRIMNEEKGFCPPVHVVQDGFLVGAQNVVMGGARPVEKTQAGVVLRRVGKDLRERGAGMFGDGPDDVAEAAVAADVAEIEVAEQGGGNGKRNGTGHGADPPGMTIGHRIRDAVNPERCDELSAVRLLARRHSASRRSNASQPPGKSHANTSSRLSRRWLVAHITVSPPVRLTITQSSSKWNTAFRRVICGVSANSFIRRSSSNTSPGEKIQPQASRLSLRTG